MRPTAFSSVLLLPAIPLLAAALLAPAVAAPQTFDFKDPKGVNNATFRLDAPLETINGSANGISGTLTVDPSKPEATTGTIVVDARTLHVENPMMKEHLHGKEWMDTATHNEIKFTVAGLDSVKQQGDTVEATVKGTFTMKGVAKEIRVPAKATLLPGKLAARTNGQQEGDLLVLRSSFTLKRTDFGINPGAPSEKVSDEIEVSLAIAGACPKKS